MLDVREAASLVRRTPETVRRWVWSGRVHAVKSGNRLLIPRAELEAAVGREPVQRSLAEWAAALPSGRPGDSAADLVLADRRSR